MGIDATIDWKKVESVDSLEEVSSTNGVRVTAVARNGAQAGTKITLSKLKKRWSSRQRIDFFSEIDSFLPPQALVEDPSKFTIAKPLFESPIVRDEKKRSAGFEVIRSGELDIGDDDLKSVISAADWVVDIDCSPERGNATIRLLPTRKFTAEFPKARARTFEIELSASADVGFQARILFQSAKSWPRAGVRIYQEGFRVLPYGEQRNDWLELDEDYKRRGRNLRFLTRVPDLGEEDQDRNVGLSFSGNSSYFGAVFLTTERSKSLRMLVNREGFEWSVSFEEMKNIVRVALDLLVRERASYTLEKRNKRREARRSDEESQSKERTGSLREVIERELASAENFVSSAERLSKSGNQKGAERSIREAVAAIREAERVSQQILDDIQTTRLLAALGLQLSAYLHEINALMAMIRKIADATGTLRKMCKSDAKTIAIQVDARVAELRRSIERQANYLTDVTSADSRRRRSKQPLYDRFQGAAALYEHEATQRGISIENAIDERLKTPIAMFSAELTLIFSNLISNAIKAAGRGGRIRARDLRKGERIVVRIENTGVGVLPADYERWFEPFESTTASTDVFLGQGMGMGLPITKDLLEEYGAQIRFVRPTAKFASAVEIAFP